VVGCAHWSGRLLVVVLEREDGQRRGSTPRPRARTCTMLLAADALPPTVFRELSVLGRRAAGV
jgi:hypothetical protein